VDTALSITDIITAVGGIVTGLLVIAGIIVKLTKTKKDDEVFEDVANVVKPVVDALDPKKPKV
jgi:hypothetical protein